LAVEQRAKTLTPQHAFLAVDPLQVDPLQKQQGLSAEAPPSVVMTEGNTLSLFYEHRVSLNQRSSTLFEQH
jgi:hypothetical protein